MGTEEMTRRKNTKLILVDARLWEYDIYNIQSPLGTCGGLVPGPAVDAKIQGCLNPLYDVIIFAYNLFTSSCIL